MSLHNQCNKWNESNFTALYNHYHDRLLNDMMKLVKDQEKAQDITASAFNAAFARRETFRGKSSFYTWVYAIGLNEARNLWSRKEPMSLDAFDADNSEAWMVSDGMSEAAERKGYHVQITTALRRIPPIYRRALVDHFVRGYSIRQIAKRRRLPCGTVLSRIFKGKQLLRRAWKEVS